MHGVARRVACAWLLLSSVGVLPAAPAGGAGVALASAPSTTAWPGVAVYGPLAEVPAGHWVYSALESLIRSGLVVEYSPGLFDQERTISRYEAAMLVVDAFRRFGLARPQTQGPAGSFTVLDPRGLLDKAGVDSGQEVALADVLARLGQELAPELMVLGYAIPGQDGRLPEGAVAARPLTVSPGAAWMIQQTTTKGPAAGRPAAPASEGGSGRAESGSALAPVTVDPAAPDVAAAGKPLLEPTPAGGTSTPVSRPEPVVSVTPSYRLSLGSTAPGRWDADARLSVNPKDGAAEGYGAVLMRGGDQWLWARVGPIPSPLGQSYALRDDDGTLSLQGIEARLLGNGGRTSLMVAREATDGLVPSPAGETKASTIAVLDGSLVLSREIVVGAALVRAGSEPDELLGLEKGQTVTSLMGRYSPLPWLSISGEYAQNLWAMPLVSAAMRVGATLRLGDVRLGASVGKVEPGFQSALGQVQPGSEVGVDATIQMGDVQLRAGAGERRPATSPDQADPAPQLLRSVGIRIGSLPGGMVQADYELISVEDLVKGRRATVSVGWGADRTRLSMGVTWAGERDAYASMPPSLEASAAMSYTLTPYASVLLGYKLIDFGDPPGDRRSNAASAQFNLRF
ncbi:hypothetical protein U7230_12480 [Carboxydochorda subterranea]|uniref:SLH domain-containing protein n=1 Tax=Carboxydichorda subterranea TaxID=3109565 RepID=A0ABZ1BWH1_9FIRM|nr:hypothetical protein [Limnochorda sp. L945t]WRP16891.1 hypothetical protein U7230_12480 [Limnochorda sp. L945t]